MMQRRNTIRLGVGALCFVGVGALYFAVGRTSAAAWERQVANYKVEPFDSVRPIPSVLQHQRIEAEMLLFKKQAWVADDAELLCGLARSGWEHKPPDKPIDQMRPEDWQHWGEWRISSAALHVIRERFASGAPVNPEAAGIIRASIAELTHHKDDYVRAASAVAAIQGAMILDVKLRSRVEEMKRADPDGYVKRVVAIQLEDFDGRRREYEQLARIRGY